jgi:hypothetical protein
MGLYSPLTFYVKPLREKIREIILTQMLPTLIL